jgi:hypothetical protein
MTGSVEPPPIGVLKNQRFDVDCSPKAGKKAKKSSGELRFFTIVAIPSAIHHREHHPPRHPPQRQIDLNCNASLGEPFQLSRYTPRKQCLCRPCGCGVVSKTMQGI